METETEALDGLDLHFLRHIVLHSLLFGLTTTLVPVVLEVGAAVFIDRAKVLTNLGENWLFSVLGLTVFFLAGCFIGSIRFALSHLPSASCRGIKRCNRQRLLEALASTGHLIQTSDKESARVIHALPNPCRPALSLLLFMGLIKITNGRALHVSPAAGSFIASLIAHLKDGNASFIGDWSAGTNEPESKRLIKMVQAIEEYRIESSPRPNASAARRIRAAIALIRADVAGVAKFLTIRSTTWNPAGAWTPVMGAEEPGDHTLADTARREIREEMKVRSEDIMYIRELTTVTDQRISKRLGILTDYTYAIYAVQLQQTSPAVQNFFSESPKVLIDYSSAVRVHEFSWLTWSQLISSDHLALEMPTVVEALHLIQPGGIPQTVSVASLPHLKSLY